MIDQTCPHCQHTFQVEKRTITDPVRCPNCRKPLIAGIGDDEAEQHVREAQHEEAPPPPEEAGESV